MSQSHEISVDEKNSRSVSTYPAQEIPLSIKRKPLPTTSKTTTSTTPSYLPPAYTSTDPTTQPTTQITKPQSLPSRIYTRYRALSTLTKTLLIFSLLAILALIIGLSAGLTHRSSNLPLPSSHGGPYTGDLTYYSPGLGACGLTSTPHDSIVSISHYVFDAVSVSSNPNANPLCGKKIRARRNGKSKDLTVVDRCVGCQPRDLDVTEGVFGDLAEIDQGRVTVEWAWLEDVPGSASGS